jgi:hypothetical protein
VHNDPEGGPMPQDRAQRFETFVTWYLRFNGYFTVPSFVVHAGDDLSRISGDVVGNHTEVDTLAIRLPHSREKSGTQFPTHDALVHGAEGKLDVVFAEVKSGNSNSPNKTWQREDRVSNIEYALRFLGWHRDDVRIKEVAVSLQQKYSFEEADLRMRYIIFSNKVNRTWSNRGVQYITFKECIRFIADERGQCWAEAGIGRRSMHNQWNELINGIFEVANDAALDSHSRQQEIRKVLETD